MDLVGAVNGISSRTRVRQSTREPKADQPFTLSRAQKPTCRPTIKLNSGIELEK
jgi:hypothetical protein